MCIVWIWWNYAFVDTHTHWSSWEGSRLMICWPLFTFFTVEKQIFIKIIWICSVSSQLQIFQKQGLASVKAHHSFAHLSIFVQDPNKSPVLFLFVFPARDAKFSTLVRRKGWKRKGLQTRNKKSSQVFLSAPRWSLPSLIENLELFKCSHLFWERQNTGMKRD